MRFFIKLIAGLIVVVVGAVIVILLTLDLNAYKGTIAQLVRGATGRQLEIVGNVQLKMGMTPSVTVEKISFANAHWGSSPHMAKLDRFTAEMELWPLLTGQINIRRVVVSGAQIVLEKDANGRGNWLFHKAGSPKAAPVASESSATVLPTVNLVVIEKSRLVYREAPGAKAV